MKINFLKNQKNFRKKIFNPNLYWTWLIYGFSTLALLSFLFGYYFFRQISKETSGNIATTNYQQVKTIKKERIDKVLKYFSEREKKSNQILNSSSPIVDPSL